MFRTTFLAIALAFVTVGTALAQQQTASAPPKVQIDGKSIPDGFEIKNIGRQANAERCKPPKQLVFSKDYIELPGSGRRYLLVCE